MADEDVPMAELEKARNFSKGRFVLGLESPHGTIMFRLRREVFEGAAREPKEVFAGLDAVTADDVKRVAQDVLGRRLYVALVGPFDEPENFEQLVAA
jgi:predicted Zn-dependent peptidase